MLCYFATCLVNKDVHIFATKVHIGNRKNLLNSNTSSACSHNMANFGVLTLDIGSGVRGTPANFNGFRALAALLHGTLVVGVSQTLRRWTGAVITLGIGPHSSYFLSWPLYFENTEYSAYISLHIQDELECGPMPNVMVALPNIGGSLCSTPQSLADVRY